MKYKLFARQSIGLLVALAVQFALGMYLNLFVTLPTNHPGTSGNDYFTRIGHSYLWGLSLAGGVALLLHILVATALLVGSVAMVVQAWRSQYRLWRVVSSVGLLGILAAMFNGLSFISYYRDLSSYIMAMGYILATLAYGLGIYLSLPTNLKKSM